MDGAFSSYTKAIISTRPHSQEHTKKHRGNVPDYDAKAEALTPTPTVNLEKRNINNILFKQ